MRRAGKIIKGVLGVLSSLALVVVLAYCVCMWLFPQQVTDLVGFRFYTIATGSMEPTIPTGSMVLVKSLARGRSPPSAASSPSGRTGWAGFHRADPPPAGYPGGGGWAGALCHPRGRTASVTTTMPPTARICWAPMCSMYPS